MGIRLEFVDLDRQFQTHSGPQPVIINDIPAFSESDMEKVNSTIYTTFSSDLLTNIPSCHCGEISGEYNIGVICEECKTPVESVMNQDLQPLVWLRAPREVSALMNPTVWGMLTEHFRIGTFSVIQWICDTNYQTIYGGNLSGNALQVIRYIEQLGIERGWNNFYNNFDTTIAHLFRMKQFRPKKGDKDNLQELIAKYRHLVFTRYIPIPHRSLLVVEETNIGVFVDPITTGVINAIRILAGVDTEMSTLSARTKENRAVRAIDGVYEFYKQTYKGTLAEKEGICRKHVYATRSHFSFRAVVSSITNAHNYDEIYIPWGVATSVFKIHLVKKLFKLGYTPSEAISLINSKARTYDPLLDQLFNEIIAESPNGRGVNATLNRNPSLARGSIQSVYITKVKTDPTDPTVSISILIVRPLNADFDGDALNFTLSIDQVIEKAIEPLQPHMSVFSLESPRDISDSLTMPKPVVGTIAAWMEDKVMEINPAKQQRMVELLGV